MTNSEVVEQLLADLEQAAAELPADAPMAIDFELIEPREEGQ
jgi:hypothetical protein